MELPGDAVIREGPGRGGDRESDHGHGEERHPRRSHRTFQCTPIVQRVDFRARTRDTPPDEAGRPRSGRLATAEPAGRGSGRDGARFDPYKSLLASAYPDTALPAAFSSAKVAATTPPHGASGAVRSRTSTARTRRTVSSSSSSRPRQAQPRAWPTAVPTSPGLALKISGKVPGHPSSALYRGTATTTDALNNATTRA